MEQNSTSQIPPENKSSSVDWVSPIYSITKEFPILCILFICPCCASYLGCDSMSNSAASCDSTSGDTQTTSIFFCWCTVIWGISRRKMSLSSRSNFRISQHCGNRLMWEGGSEYYSHFHQGKLMMSCWGSCLGPQQRAWTTIGELLFSCPVLSSAQVLLFTAFCQCPEDRKSKN